MRYIKTLLLALLFTTLTIQAEINYRQVIDVQNFVKRFYVKVLGRAADNGGLDSWTNQLISKEKTGADVGFGFVFSTEFVAKDKNDNDFVTILYKAFFNREPDAAGLEGWLLELSNGTSREDLLSGFLHSQEFINLANAYGIQAFVGASFESEELSNFVKRFYTVILGRDADSDGLTDWIGRLSSGSATGSDIAFGFVFSTEYNINSKNNSEYLITLYRAFFNREPDIVGLEEWLNHLNTGMSREEVLNNFLHSQEFINLSNAYNITAFPGAPTIEPTPNTTPISDAGSNKSSFLGDTVTLDASASTDSDGTLLYYIWSENGVILGEGMTLSKSDFTVGTHTLLLTVVDDGGKSGSDEVTILVEKEKEDSTSDNTTPLTIYDLSYKGLTFYHQNMIPSDYSLNQLTDNEFNALTNIQKQQVANTLLSTLFFGYPHKELQEKINSGHFISDIQSTMEEETTDKAWLENHILDDDIFTQYDRWAEPQAVNILSRFYAMKDLDSYFLKNWTAYILTQTIMFSPAYELESTHTPNISSIYNRIVTFLNEESGMRYITYVHMMTEDNWRRFRSPEDNGREMLEIFQFDMDDSHVPIAGQALQNWKLNTDGDTLEVSLNQNTEPLNLFGTIITNGDDFYRELVKADLFTKGVSRRLVNFFFPEATESKKLQLTNAIVSSQPETWQDILLQIVFSKEYLLYNKRAKSAEETFFSLAKKMDFKHRKSTLYYFKEALENMHQASMKYKLGKLKRVPQDTLSFAYYHKYIRKQVLLRKSNPNAIDDYAAWDRQGWDESFVANHNYTLDENDGIASLESFIQYLFKATISRSATTSEMNLFKEHMLENESDSDPTKVLRYSFNLIDTRNDLEEQRQRRESRKRDIATIVLDYISRLSETYTVEKVK